VPEQRPPDLRGAAELRRREQGKFPPTLYSDTVPPPANFWFDEDRIGRYFRRSGIRFESPAFNYKNMVTPAVFLCPEDEQAVNSYSMNWWASSAVGSVTTRQSGYFPKAGRIWGANTKESSKLMLVMEPFSHYPVGGGLYSAYPAIPWIANVVNPDEFRFYPGFSFVGDQRLGTGPSGNQRYLPYETPFDWARHRQRADGGTRKTEARGRANFGFADGHVASFRPEELADRATKKSKFVALWSPLDYHVERLPRPPFP
jgi:prepilin-type processing-associated H-X9-DG protein